MTSSFSLPKFFNLLKNNNNTLAFLEYKNKYLDILFILVHQGLLRGFYFEYVLSKKYIVVLFKYKIDIQFDFLKVFNAKKINKNFRLSLWTTNCGILINLNKKKLNGLIVNIL